MVNKKLSVEDEENIYIEWLTGKPLTSIAEHYPVVISTIQRVIKKKSRVDGTKKNFIISNIFRHLKNANDPLEIALKMFEDNNEMLHEKQKEFLLKSLNNISKNIDMLVENIEQMEI